MGFPARIATIQWSRMARPGDRELLAFASTDVTRVHATLQTP